MNKNVHFLEETIISNDNKKIYDMKFINENLLTICDISGAIHYYSINENLNSKLLKTLQLFSPEDENSLFTIDHLSNMTLVGTSKGDLLLLNNEKKIFHYNINKNSNNNSISKCLFINENLYSIGDSNGKIKIYDIRLNKIIKNYEEQSEEITDIVYSEIKENYILSSSIDGTLAVYDIRQKKIYALSDCIEEEINKLQIMKNSNKILAATSEGYIEIFNWGWFGDFKDRIKGHPQSVLSMDKYDENLVISGCEDGGIRICSVVPKGIRGIISNKNNIIIDNEEFNEVNCIQVLNNGLIASLSNISFVKIFDGRNINFSKIYQNSNEDNESDYEDSEDNYEESDSKEKNEVKNKENKNFITEDNIPEISDDKIEEYEEEEEDEEEEEEEEEESKNEDNRNEEKLKNDINLFESEDEQKDKSEKESENIDDNNEDRSSYSSDSSDKIKRKRKKIETLGKKRKSNSIIETERRKAFFDGL